MPERLNPTSRILAIDPGTREMGIAVLAGQELEYYAVKTITQRRSSTSIISQACQIVRKLLKLHRPQILAVEKPFLGYGARSSLLSVVAREILTLGQRHGCNILEINPKTAKKIVAGSGSATKREVASVVCSRFPELRIYLRQAHQYQEKYWANLFDAVAIALSAAELSK